VHPIERLRFVARASGVEQGLLVRETAGALSALGFDPAGTVTACRRVLDRHPTSGALWWLASRVLTTMDGPAEAWRCADEIDADPTPGELAYALPSDARVCVLGWPELVGEALPRRGDLEVLVVDVAGEGTGLVRRLRRAEVDAVDVPVAGLGAAAASSDVVLVEVSALGRGGAVAVSGSRAAAAVACHAGVPVWAVVGVGRALPPRTYRALAARLDDEEPWEADDEVVPLDLLTGVVGPDGVGSLPDALARGEALVEAPELFRPAL
jgi:hypothetical protein